MNRCQLLNKLKELLGIFNFDVEENCFEIGSNTKNLESFLSVWKFNPQTGYRVSIWPNSKPLLGEFSKILLNIHFKDQKKAFHYEEWEEIVSNNIPKVLANYDQEKLENVKNDPSSFLKELNKKIKNNLNEIKPQVWVMGCNLVHWDLYEKLVIGPVTFLRRGNWLDLAVKNNQITSDERKQIDDHLKNRSAIQKKVISNKIAPIVDTLRNGYFVCEVIIDRHMGTMAGREAAMTLARLALTTIALYISKNASKSLRSLYLSWDWTPNDSQHLLVMEPPYLEYKVGSIRPEKSNSYTFNSNLDNHIPDPFLDNHIPDQDTDNIFWTAGEIFNSFLQGGKHDDIRHPKMAYTLFQSLFWFHEGCKQVYQQIAVANFITSIDALVCGTRKEGIKNLMKKKFPDAYSVEIETEIEDYYTKRSRVLHGTSDELGFDWYEEKHTLEMLSRYLILSCLIFYSEHRGKDDPKLFF